MLRRDKLRMEQNKLTRLNALFEKVVSDKANGNEQRELKGLYQEYINDGRECLQVQKSSHYHQATA
jgi:uncharacterized protein YnzC (UPF0291/DUF896 family)